MASPERSRDHTVSRLLVEQPQRFEFFEAVRILERMMPDRASIGGDADPRRETLRFTTHARLGFPSGDLERIELPEEPGDARPSAPARVQLNFMSLLAPNSFGSLPTPYAVLARDEERAGRTALRDFLDVFTHRFVSLFYRAWGKSRIAVAAEHAHASYFERGVLAQLFLMALIALVAHYVFAAAFARAEVSVLAPFEYTALLWAVLIGYTVWRDIPSLEVWLGAAIIVGCGLYVIHRESLQRKSRVTGHSDPLP